MSRRAAPLVLPVAELLLVERQRGSQRGICQEVGVVVLGDLEAFLRCHGWGRRLRAAGAVVAVFGRRCIVRRVVLRGLAAGTARFAGVRGAVRGGGARRRAASLASMEQQGLLACAQLPSRSLQRQGETATAGRAMPMVVSSTTKVRIVEE